MLKINVPRQLPSNTTADNIEIIGRAAEVIAFGGIGWNFIFAFSMNQVWSMLNGLQLITHLPLFRFNVPSNANYMTSFLIKIATFDPIQEEWIKSVFTFPDQDPYDEQFESCNYGGIHSFENLGMTCVLLHAYLLMSFFLLLFTIIRKNYRMYTTVTKLHTYLFYAWPLRCFYEGFLEITVSVSIHYSNMIWKDATIGMLYCNVATFALTLILSYLMIQIVVYYFKIKDLDEDKFRDRYGVLYDGLYINHLRKELHDQGISYYLQWQEEITDGIII